MSAHADARRRLGLPNGKLIAYLGHYNPVKGASLLPAAFALVRPRFDDAWLVLAWSGLGPDRPVAKAIARAGVGDRTIQLGEVSVEDLLSVADVIVLPYRMTCGQSTFPEVVLEAMTAGKAIVTSRLPVLEEILTDGVNASLVRPGNPAAFGGAIVRLLVNPDLADRLGQAARRESLRFAPDAVAGEYEALFQRLVGASERNASLIGMAR